jgi:ribosomal subunit interface protein
MLALTAVNAEPHDRHTLEMQREKKGLPMKLPVQVTFQDFTPSAALDTAVRERASKLEQFHPHMISCRAVVSRESRHHQQGNTFTVHFDIKVKGQEIAITNHADEDPFVALRNAADAARRQLEDHARAQRGEVKAHSR